MIQGGYMLELDYKALGKRIKIARINADMTQDRLSTNCRQFLPI